MDFFAHSHGPDKAQWQLLKDHLRKVAMLTRPHGQKFQAGAAAGLAGLFHDLGKYSMAFQHRLEGGKSIDHATAGAREVIALAKTREDSIAVQLVAYAIAGHHAGLADHESLSERLRDKPLESLDPVWRREVSPDAETILPAFRWRQDRLAFQLAFLGRMLFSCLIDADRTDTAQFYDGWEARAPVPAWPSLPGQIDRLRVRFDTHMNGLPGTGDVNRLRRDVLAHVRAKGALQTGLFTLTVPTGGGKTLASLAFALDHAKQHGLERIVYAIPFTSVIDQTVSIFETVLGEEMIFAHHASIDEEVFKQRWGEEKLKLTMEDWAAPIVVTTNVQFFESLFSHRPSKCRKLHNLAKSVIILDEAQTIPLHVLRPCLAALDELARNYGCSIVLCTATQPAVTEPEFTGGLTIPPDRELAPDPADLHRRLKRVTARHAGVMSDDDLVAALSATSQGLVIVNTRAHALALYRAVKDAGLDGVLHLTTRQYAADRRLILDKVRGLLHNEQPCHLIATSLVEAGVDLDFPLVWRAEAGLSSIVQAAGRCNREGRRDPADSIVTVFQAAEFQPSREVANMIGDMGRAARTYPDLLSLEAIKAYFGEVYWRMGADLDRIRVLTGHLTIGSGKAVFNYRTIGENFKLIEEGMVPVIIATDPKAEAALGELSTHSSGPGRIARRLQNFVVQVPPKARNALLASGNAAFRESKTYGDQFCVLKNGKLYEEDVGLVWENADYLALEANII